MDFYKVSDLVYLRITGEKQGDISSGCGSYASIGNRWQIGHEDQILAFSLLNTLASTGNSVNLQWLKFLNLSIKALLCSVTR